MGKKRDGRSVTSPLSALLRGAGFVPLPRLWVKKKDLPEILRMAKQYEPIVSAARKEVREKHDALWENQKEQDRIFAEAERQRQEQLEEERDRAWSLAGY